MAKRLISLQRIRAEKIDRGRSWIYDEIKAGRFPKPVNSGSGASNLWDEEEVNHWLEDFIARAKARAAQVDVAQQAA